MTPVHTIVQITDLHLVADGVLLQHRLDTADALARALAAVEASRVTPTALLLTGDLTDTAQPGAYRRLRELVEPVAQRLGAPVLYLMGNHDDRATLREHLLDEAPGRTPVDEPYDHVTRLGGLRIIALDSTVPGRPSGDLTDAQLAWLAAELADPAPDGTVLALHHPPLPSPSRLSTAIRLRDPAALGDVLAGSDVRIVLAGHTHVVSAGALAGIPVWTGGTTAFTSDPLAPGDGERGLLTPSVSRVDLYADSLIVTAVPVGATVAGAITGEQVDRIVEEEDRRSAERAVS